MSAFEIIEEGEYPMILVSLPSIGGMDEREYTADAHEHGHPTEELRCLGATGLQHLAELVANPDN